MSADEINYHRHLVIGVETLVKVLSFASFGLRLWARRVSESKLWWDDYIMGIGLVFASIPGICNYLGLRYGLGKHLAQISEHDAERFLILFYILQLGYVSTLPTVKISVLFFYHRIFPQKRFRMATYSMGLCLVLFLLSSWLVVSLQCLPIYSFWRPKVPHSCIHQVKYYVAHGCLNFIMDLAVVLMPIPYLLKLHLPRHQKVGLVILFLLGGLACAMALCRIIALYEVKPDDITWTNVSPGLWSSAEAGALVLSGNLPLMKPLLVRATAYFKNHHLQYQISKDEESTNILELSQSINKSKTKDKPGEETNVGFSDCWEESRSVVVGGATNASGTSELRAELPHDRILVEMDLEQNIHSLGAVSPERPGKSWWNAGDR